MIVGPLIRRWTLLVLTTGVPVLFLRTGADPFNVPKLALLTVGLSLVVSAWVMENVAGAKRTGAARLMVPAAALVIPLTVSWTASPYRGFALMGDFPRFQGLLPYVLVVIFGLMLASAFDARTAFLAWALVLAGAVVGAYAIVQELGADPFQWVLGTQPASQALSTLGNPNFTGGFLGIVLPIAVGLYALDVKRSTTLKLMVPIVAGWLLARSEGGWAAGIAGLCVIGGFILYPRWRKARVLGILGGAAVAVALVGAVLFTIGKASTPLPFTVEERGQWWVAASRMGATSPVVGKGPNAFAVEGVQYRTTSDALDQAFEYTDDPHSVPLSLFASGGVLGLLGYLVLVGWVAWKGLRLTGDDLLGATFFAATTAYIVQSLVSIDELALRIALWVGLAGLALRRESDVKLDPSALREVDPSARTKRGKGGRNATAAPSRRTSLIATSIVGGLLLVASLLWSGGLVLADHRFNTGMVLIRGGEIESGSAAVEEALAFRDEIHYRHLYGFELGRAALDLEDGDDLIAAMRDQFAFVQEVPDLPSLRDYARLLYEWFLDSNDDSALDNSVEVYGLAVDLDPLNPRLRAERAQVLIEAEEYQTAIAELTNYLNELGTEVAEHPRARDPKLWGYLAIARVRSDGEAGALQEVPSDFLKEVAGLDVHVAILVAERFLSEDRYSEIEPILAPVTSSDEPIRSPLLARAWGALALARAHVENLVGAESAVDQALRLDADQPWALEAKKVIQAERRG